MEGLNSKILIQTNIITNQASETGNANGSENLMEMKMISEAIPPLLRSAEVRKVYLSLGPSTKFHAWIECQFLLWNHD